MCGILLVAAAVTSEQQSWEYIEQQSAECVAALKPRGPDHFGSRQVLVPCSHDKAAAAAAAAAEPHRMLLLHLAASLLQLRGNSPSTSPLRDSKGNILCFNGEIFGGLEVPEGSNDGRCLAAALGAVSEVDDVTPLLSRLRGPWAIIYWQHETQTLWFGRDWIGRRSLLLKPIQDDCERCFVLSSVAPTTTAAAAAAATSQGAAAGVSSSTNRQQHSWIEVPPGLYSISGADLLQYLLANSSSSSRNSNNCSGQAYHTVETNSAAAAASSAASTCVDGADVIADSPNGGVCTPQDLCNVIKGLHHHPWGDSQLQQLQQYSRAQRFIPASGMETDAKQQQLAYSCCTVQHKQQQQQQQQEAACNGEATVLLQQQQQQQQQQHGDSSRQLPQEAACQSVLQLLQTAVNTRCWTINTVQQCMQCSMHLQQQQVADALQQQLQINGGLISHNAASAGNIGQCNIGQGLQPLLAPSPILILFSGGVDSTIIAALTHLALPADVPIDLSNVCFVAGASPDRHAAHSALLELAAFAPERQWRLIEVNSSLEEVDQHMQHIQDLLHPAGTVMDLNIGAALWLAARAEAQQVLVPVLKDSIAAGAAAAAAAMGSDQSSQIEAASSRGEGSSAADSDWCLVPAIHALSAMSSPPGAAGAAGAAENHVKQALPSSTSSSSSGGRMYCYKSAARVVLLGHGADEQCGGYGRHRTAFKHLGWQGLADEMAVDVKRLWIRNLGRDDRLVADHAREGRHPFLDEDLMTLLLNMPLDLLADVSKARGTGDKHILRGILQSLGLPVAAAREKRAIQFGSRIGKLSNRREFGSNRKANLLSAGQVQIHKLPNALLPKQQQHEQ